MIQQPNINTTIVICDNCKIKMEFPRSFVYCKDTFESVDLLNQGWKTDYSVKPHKHFCLLCQMLCDK